MFEEAETGHGDWQAAAVAYARTPAGHARFLEELVPVAEMIGDVERVDALNAVLLRAEFEAAQAGLVTAADQRPAPVVGVGELQQVGDAFGVAAEPVRRDHAISHILAALSGPQLVDSFVFHGGTALSRTVLPGLRLSEDIDLIARADRRATAEAIEHTLEMALARSHAVVVWEPALSATRGAQSGVLRTPGGVTVRIQLMKAEGLPAWPTQRRALIQRFSDAPPASLDVFTPAAFVAAKTLAWGERRAARDLYDLWALALLGHIDAAARAAYHRWGWRADPGAWQFEDPPSQSDWDTALAHQGRIRVGPTDALRVVRAHWAAATSED